MLLCRVQGLVKGLRLCALDCPSPVVLEGRVNALSLGALLLFLPKAFLLQRRDLITKHQFALHLIRNPTVVPPKGMRSWLGLDVLVSDERSD